MGPTERRTPLAFFAVLACAGACSDQYGAMHLPSDADAFFTRSQWEDIQSLTPESFEPPPDPSNRYADDPVAAALGQRLYFDTRLGNTEVLGKERSCATCHIPSQAFSDAGLLDEAKDITSVLNIAFYDYHTMSGKFDSLWSMPMAPTENGFLESDRLRVARLIATSYRDGYACAFGSEYGEDALFFDRQDAFDFPSWDAFLASDPAQADVQVVNRIYANYGKAFAAYMRRINSGRSKFDAYASGQTDLFSEDEKSGLRLFLDDANCFACHEGPYFTDNEFHDIGIEVGGDSRYEGLIALHSPGTPSQFRLDSEFSDDPTMLADDHPQPAEADIGAYRTPSLRNVSLTAPYMHNRKYETLQEVIWHYRSPPIGDGNTDPKMRWELELTDLEELQIIAFLQTLDGDFDGPMVDAALLDDQPPWPQRCGL